MSCTDTDSWDLASSVGATATMVTAARNRLDVFANYGRMFPVDDTAVPLSDSVAVTAVRTVGGSG